MKNLDRRVLRTRRALAAALVSLSKEKDYDRITVSDLTNRADIGYATFYRHYKSKDELLTKNLENIMLDIEREIIPGKMHYEQSIAVYNIIDRHHDILRLALSLPRDHQAMEPLWRKAVEVVTNLYLARDEATIPLKVSVNHLTSSIAELIRWWLDEGQAYSPQQMAKMQTELIITVTEQVGVMPRGAEGEDNSSSQRELEISETEAPPRIPN